MNQNKHYKYLYILLLLLIIIPVIGLIYSLYYEIAGYKIDFLPDMGTPSSFFGTVGTIITVIFTWQQIQKADNRAHESRKITEEKLKKAQEQFNITIAEMQREREQAYKPDLFISTLPIKLTLKNDMTKDYLKNKTLKMINIGPGSARNIRLERYISPNITKLSNDSSKIKINGNYLNYHLKDRVVTENLYKLSKSYLFPKEVSNIKLPVIYLLFIRDLIFSVNGNLDKFSLDMRKPYKFYILYQDSEGINYIESVQVVIYVRKINFNDVNVIQSAELELCPITGIAEKDSYLEKSGR